MAVESDRTVPNILIGVVTVTYNSSCYLNEFFKSCEQQSEQSYRLYAIDNCSADDSVQQLHTRAAVDPRVVAIANRNNVGVAAGNNQGIVKALEDGCEWVLLLNNDTTFPVDTFAQLVGGCREKQWRVAVPKIHYDTPRGHIWYGGGGFNPRRGHTGYHVGKDEPDHGQYDASHTVDYSPTCAMLVHRSVFFEVGLMDETYFVYFDDTDFCWRLRQHRVAIGYWPSATLVHKIGGSTGGGASVFSARIVARNRLYFLRKHFGPLSPLFWVIAFLSYYIGRYLIASWKPALFLASIEGSLAYSAMRPNEPMLEFGAALPTGPK